MAVSNTLCRESGFGEGRRQLWEPRKSLYRCRFLRGENQQRTEAALSGQELAAKAETWPVIGSGEEVPGPCS